MGVWRERRHVGGELWSFHDFAEAIPKGVRGESTLLEDGGRASCDTVSGENFVFLDFAERRKSPGPHP